MSSSSVVLSRPPLALTAARVVFGVVGIVKLLATGYFLFFASAAEGGAPEGLLDWSVGIWSTALASAFLTLAARLRPGADRLVRAATALLLVEVAFSIVKLTVYGEPEAVTFMAADAVLLALLAVATRRSARN